MAAVVAVYTVEGPGAGGTEKLPRPTDFVTYECDNRGGGCSSKENVIYACKLGDPTSGSPTAVASAC